MSTRKNLSYNLINQITAVLFPFITVPYVSRVLGVENIGIIGFSNAFTGYFTVLAALGVSIYGSREIAKYKNDKYILHAFLKGTHATEGGCRRRRWRW